MLNEKCKKFSFLIFAIAGWYIFLCSLHLFQQRPLWNDEAVVFQSIERYSAKQIFGGPLMVSQVFPRLYLYTVQQFSKVFDFSLWSLRLPSFICMITAFFLWLKIARKNFKDKWQYLAFVASWPASGMLLYYSAELKQYSMDVLVTALFVLFLCHQKNWHQQKSSRYVMMLIGLPALGLFSYPGFFCATLVLYNLLLYSLKDRRSIKYLGVYLASLAVFFSVSYFFDMRFREADIYSKILADHFIHFSSVGGFFTSFGEGVNNLFSRWFIERPKFFKPLARIFVGFGLIYLFYGFFKNRKQERGLLHSLELIAPALFAVMFIVGCLQKYPFSVPRTSLFYAPIVLYLTARGIGLAGVVHQYFYRFVLGLYFVFLGFLIVMQSILAFWGRLSFFPTLW